METLQQTRPQKAGQILNQLLSVLSLSLYDDLSASDPHFRLMEMACYSTIRVCCASNGDKDESVEKTGADSAEILILSVLMAHLSCTIENCDMRN
ncbi:hypothetical protein T08_9579 [Trichinella sp. T8]|nr:hypothetical protein T08_9579 [Trichinella sp. T8]